MFPRSLSRRTFFQMMPAIVSAPFLLQRRAAEAADPSSVFTGDARLEGSGTGVFSYGESISDLLARLARESGVALSTAPGAWAEQRTLVFAASASRATVLNAIASLYGLSWTKAGGIPSAYLLAQSADIQKADSALFEQERVRVLAPLLRFATYARSVTPEVWATRAAQAKQGHLERRLAEDPLLKNRYNLSTLADPTSNAYLRFVAALNPRQQRILADDGRLEVPWIAMTPLQQEIALATLRHNGPRYDPTLFKNNQITGEALNRLQEAESAHLKKQGLRFQVMNDLLTQGIVRLNDEGTMGFRTYAILDDALFQEDGSYARSLPVRGKPAALTLSATPLSLAGSLTAQPFPTNAAIDTEKDNWPQVLEKLSRLIEMPFFSDDLPGMEGVISNYRRRPGSPGRGGFQYNPFKPTDHLTLAEGLDQLCRIYGRLWWSENGALFFRGRVYPLQRLYEVPPSLLREIARFAQVLGKGKSGEDSHTAETLTWLFALLYTLSPKQVMGLAGCAVADGQIPHHNLDRSAAAHMGFGFREVHLLLGLYASLTPTQRTTALSPDGLADASLTPDQKAICEQLVDAETARSAEFQQKNHPLPALQITLLSPPTPAVSANKALRTIRLLLTSGHLTRFLTVAYPTPLAAEPER